MKQHSLSQDVDVEIAASLEQADQHMQAAIEAFGRANRLHLRDLIRPNWSENQLRGREEAHVEYGLTALINANEQVTAATRQIEHLPKSHPNYEPLGTSVRKLNTSFESLFTDLRRRPNPRQLLTELKRVRRIIPRTSAQHSTLA